MSLFWTPQAGPLQLHGCFAGGSKEDRLQFYNRTCLGAPIHGSLTANTPKNGRAWRAHFSSDLRPFQGTILLQF